MHRTLPFHRTAAALLLAGLYLPLHAQAQSNVTLYGILDVLMEHRSAMDAAGNGRTALSSGGLNTSRWGLRGSEDLGSGLKAVFNLESEISMDTGAGGSSLFGRQANVGLEGGWGRLIGGRSYSTTYDFLLPFDPMGYAPFYSWATSGGAIATNARKDGMVTGVSNLLKYQGSFGPVKLGASYGFGEVTGAANAGRFAAVAAAYTAGPFSAALVLDQRNGSTVTAGTYDKEKATHLALSYDLTPVRLFAAQRRYKKEIATGGDAKSTMSWIGATWSVTPVIDLTAALYKQDIKSGVSGTDDPKLLALRGTYALSKRTRLYAVAARATSKDGGLVSVSRDDNGYRDGQSGYGVGIQHRF
jgi:predicted porin